MIVGRPDWCVSRQRTWGVPITLFIHKETGALHPRTDELIEAVALLIEKEGIEAWFSLVPTTLLGVEAEQYQKIPDTLDVWFDSGVTHTAVLKRREELSFPADLYLEGSDQHRGWFQSSLLSAMAMQGVSPYKSVLTHGFTVDADGKKMSKSLGNVVAPQTVMNAVGADVLRLWVAATDYRGEIGLPMKSSTAPPTVIAVSAILRGFCCPIWTVLIRQQIVLKPMTCWHWIAGWWIVLICCRKRLKRLMRAINSN